MEHYDVTVIGGGPAGATTARTLAEAGIRVLVLDSASFPRVKLCAGWVTPHVWETLEIAPEDYPGTLQPFSRATLALGGRVRETRWDRTVSYGILRREFDHYLLQRAEAAGAEVRTGIRVGRLRREGGCWRVPVDDYEVSAAMLIGAGGHQCPVARSMDAIDPAETVVMARESETRLDSVQIARITQTPGIPELIVEEDLNGFGWVFSKGNFLNVGFGCVDHGRGLNQRCNDFQQRLVRQGRLPAEIELEPFRGHAYAVRLQGARCPAGDGWLLVGDAAGLARPLSGEGIGPAVLSARLAASSILEAAPERYPDQLATEFGPGEPGRIGGWVGQLPRAALNGMGRVICHQPHLRRKLVFEGAFGMRAEQQP